MEPFLEKRASHKPGQYPVRYLVDQFGGQVMSFIWMALAMSFVVALVKPDALLGFAACITGLGGALAYRAVGEDRHIKTKLLNGTAAADGGH